MRISGVNISYRIKTIAECVKFDTLCDIGTDHGYLLIFLAKQGKIKKAAACDVNPQPLSRAKKLIYQEFSEKQNIKQDLKNIENIIKTRLGNGLAPVEINEFDTCVISGMGGMLIIDILSSNIEKAKSFKQIILSPQLDIYSVRRFLHNFGFRIDNEIMIFDARKWYNIIDCHYTGTKDCYNEIEYTFGKILIEKRCEILKSFLSNEIKKTEHILHNNDVDKLRKYLNLCLETYKCL